MHVVLATTAPRYWRPQAVEMATALGRQGHDAQVVTTEDVAAKRGSASDVLICLGTGEYTAAFLHFLEARRRILYLLESIPTPSESDNFTSGKLKTHQPFFREFDHVFVHSRRSLAMLKSLGLRNAEELLWPHFPSLFFRAEPNPEFDLVFLGAPSPHRNRILERLSRRFKVMAHQGVFHEKTGAAYARGRIILNLHFTPLPNLECRVVEVLGCGAFLMTETLDPIDVFCDGEHLIVFDQTNMEERVARYLGDEESRKRIASAGHAAAQELSVEKQVVRIVEVAERLLSAAGP